MTELTKEEVEEIVERELPGWRVLDAPEPLVDRRPPDWGTPELAALRSDRSGDGHDVADSVGGGDQPDEVADEIVIVSPPNSPDQWARGPGPKSIVVSGRKRKIIGNQG